MLFFQPDLTLTENPYSLVFYEFQTPVCNNKEQKLEFNIKDSKENKGTNQDSLFGED